MTLIRRSLRADPRVRPAGTRDPIETKSAAETHHRQYSSPDGNRSFDLFVPSGYGDTAVPLVVMLHGTGQDPADFALGTGMNEQAELHKFLVAYPAQSVSANATGSWNWFREQDQHADSGEPALIAGLTRHIAGEFAVDPDRIYIAGMSSGGAMAAVMAATYPELYAAVGVHSGLAHGAASGLMSGLMAMHTGGPTPSHTGVVPLIVFHGDADSTVTPVNADRLISARIGAAEPPAARATTLFTPAEVNARAYTHTVYTDPDGSVAAESWIVHGAGHAWSGGHPDGSYTDPLGRSATAEMTRFFLEHPRGSSRPNIEPLIDAERAAAR